MLSDPISVTVGGSAKSLPRVGPFDRPQPRKIQSNTYMTADGTVSVTTSQGEYRDGSRRAEITLRQHGYDLSSSTNYDGPVTPGVGFVFEWGPGNLGSSDITSLRADLIAFVDATLQGRIIAGES